MGKGRLMDLGGQVESSQGSDTGSPRGSQDHPGCHEDHSVARAEARKDRPLQYSRPKVRRLWLVGNKRWRVAWNAQRPMEGQG